MNARLVGLASILAAIVGCYESANSYGQNSARTVPRELPSRTAAPSRTERISSTGPMTLDQVDQLMRAGLDDQIIGRVVRERGLNRPLTVEDLLTLRQNGVSNELIGELQQAGNSPAKYTTTFPTASPAVTTPASVATPTITTPTVVEVREPAPVIVRTVPSYYYAPPPRVYVHAPYYYHPYHHYHGHYHGHGHHHGGRVSFGFTF